VDSLPEFAATGERNSTGTPAAALVLTPHQCPASTRVPPVRQVDIEEDGEQQRVHVRVQYPGRLLLHWGVEGGAGYEGGWRLPGDAARPPNTVAYKNRALQTPLE